jgi:CheY-like chemotaxis protein
MSTVLIIDDDRDITDLLSDVLKRLGYSTLVAHDGREGIRKASGHPPNMILCDARMPVLSGPEVLDVIRKMASTASIPFVLMSGNPEFRTVDGHDGFLQKPFVVAEALELIQRLLPVPQTSQM